MPLFICFYFCLDGFSLCFVGPGISVSMELQGILGQGLLIYSKHLKIQLNIGQAQMKLFRTFHLTFQQNLFYFLKYIFPFLKQPSQVSRIILATDVDKPGKALAEELARRLGKERLLHINLNLNVVSGYKFESYSLGKEFILSLPLCVCVGTFGRPRGRKNLNLGLMPLEGGLTTISLSIGCP